MSALGTLPGYRDQNWTPAETLSAGDRYFQSYHDELILVEVLRDREEIPTGDEFFGRDGHFKFWARRDDTGAEGWILFGPGGKVPPLVCSQCRPGHRGPDGTCERHGKLIDPRN